jgi:hypothetical protein
MERERKRKKHFPFPMQEIEEQKLKWWSSSLSLIAESWGEYTWSKVMGLGG